MFGCAHNKPKASFTPNPLYGMSTPSAYGTHFPSSVSTGDKGYVSVMA
jgi:hypothetical protein